MLVYQRVLCWVLGCFRIVLVPSKAGQVTHEILIGIPSSIAENDQKRKGSRKLPNFKPENGFHSL